MSQEKYIIEKIIGKYKDIVALYPYGSRVYNTNDFKSDYDYILILNGCEDSAEHNNSSSDITIYSIESFQEQVSEHRIAALECLFLPQDKKIVENISWNFKLDKKVLRDSISQKASHSWVKAKKKLEVEDETRLAIKSMFHSFRIIDFGIQIANHGKIINYESSNDIYQELMLLEKEDWNKIGGLFKERHNNLMSEFRKVCPK